MRRTLLALALLMSSTACAVPATAAEGWLMPDTGTATIHAQVMPCAAPAVCADGTFPLVGAGGSIASDASSVTLGFLPGNVGPASLTLGTTPGSALAVGVHDGVVPAQSGTEQLELRFGGTTWCPLVQGSSFTITRIERAADGYLTALEASYTVNCDPTALATPSLEGTISISRPLHVLTSMAVPGVDLLRPAVSASGYRAWSQATRDALYLSARLQAPRSPARSIGASNMNVWVSGIAGRDLLIQEENGLRSDLVLIDVVSRKRKPLPRGVSTAAWEWQGAISTRTIAFVRGRASAKATVYAYDRARRKLRKIVSVARGSQIGGLAAAGPFLAYSLCNATGTTCTVVRYDMRTGKRQVAPRLSGTLDYAPSLTADGVAFFARSGYGCGASVRLERWVPGTPPKVLTYLPSATDVESTSVVGDAIHASAVYWSQTGCAGAFSPIEVLPIPVR